MEELFIIGHVEIINDELIMYVEGYLCCEDETQLIPVKEYEIKMWQQLKNSLDPDDWPTSIKFNGVLWRLHIYVDENKAADAYNDNLNKLNPKSEIHKGNDFLKLYYDYQSSKILSLDDRGI